MVRIACLISALATAVLGKVVIGEAREGSEIREFSQEEYSSGEVHMGLRERKLVRARCMSIGLHG